jgi:hypothetical protein
VIEPFVGTGDLLKFIDRRRHYTGDHDIDPKYEGAARRGHLTDPPDYTEVRAANPPYLARNERKQSRHKLRCNDLYKCFLATLIGSGCLGGIVIVP